ncbi:MAG: HU family DNA-binding protein [Bacteroides sp.]|uniref:HU family DNA-binding protein n=1 Tax=Bacteroides sp. TaxID=29523 RepID=UPI002FCA1AD0
MAFFKKIQQKINGLWYPKSITVGKPVTTDQIADRLAQISTVSRADTYAVLKDLGSVMADYMVQGRTVKMDGLGTFYYTAVASGQGVDAPEKVKSTHITGVRVRFIPEATRNNVNKVTTRALVSDNIFWEEWGGKGSSEEGDGEPENPFE